MAGLAVVAAASMSGCAACQVIFDHTVTANPSSATVGEEVTFTPSYRLTESGKRESRFDLDGNGFFETSAPPRASVTRTYDQPANIVVAHELDIEIHKSWADSSLAFTQLIVREPGVENDVPLADFAISPQPVDQERPVTFDASGSSDPDGSIVRYEWELNGDGRFDVDSADPVYELQTGYIEDQVVTLRVTDNEGATAEVQRTVIVQEPPPLPPDPRLARRVARAGDEFTLTPEGGHVVDDGGLYLNGDQLLRTDVQAVGRVPDGLLPARLGEGGRAVQIAAKFDLSQELAADTASGGGFALLSFPAGGRACAAFEIETGPGGTPEGSFRVLGGKGGDADRLRGSGNVGGSVVGDELAVEGLETFRLAGERNFDLAHSECADLRSLLTR